MPALSVGDRVLYEGKRWVVEALSLRSQVRHGDQLEPRGEQHATLLLQADPPGSLAPFKRVLAQSEWDEVRLLTD